MNNKNNQGFSLIEVLVSLLILAVGLLGLSQLQVTSMKYNQSAFYRSQASVLATDMFERMRANQVDAVAGNYLFTLAQGLIAIPVGGNANVRETDINQWLTLLSNMLPDGDGSVSCVDADATDGAGRPCSTNSIYTITIQWTETQANGAKGFSSFIYSGAL